MIVIIVVISFLLLKLNEYQSTIKIIEEDLNSLKLNYNDNETELNDLERTLDSVLTEKNQLQDEINILTGKIEELSFENEKLNEDYNRLYLENTNLLQDRTQIQSSLLDEDGKDFIDKAEIELIVKIYQTLYDKQKLKKLVFETLELDANSYHDGSFDNEGGLGYVYKDQKQGTDYITYTINPLSGVIYDEISHSYIDNIFGVDTLDSDELIINNLSEMFSFSEDDIISFYSYDKGNQIYSIGRREDSKIEWQYKILVDVMTNIVYDLETKTPLARIIFE